jgi:hypothetical protein
MQKQANGLFGGALMVGLFLISQGRGASAPVADEPLSVSLAPKAAPAAASGLAAKSADIGIEYKTIDRPDFTLKYPVGWTEDTQARDYDANTNFTLFSQKNSSIQIVILNKADDIKKVVDNAIKKIDNVQITTLSRANLTSWGPAQNPIKGLGQHLKGKIVDSFPGGIKIFCFSSPKHNVLIIETYFSDDLKDVQADIDFIGRYFEMKN